MWLTIFNYINEHYIMLLLCIINVITIFMLSYNDKKRLICLYLSDGNYELYKDKDLQEIIDKDTKEFLINSFQDDITDLTYICKVYCYICIFIHVLFCGISILYIIYADMLVLKAISIFCCILFLLNIYSMYNRKKEYNTDK